MGLEPQIVLVRKVKHKSQTMAGKKRASPRGPKNVPELIRSTGNLRIDQEKRYYRTVSGPG